MCDVGKIWFRHEESWDGVIFCQGGIFRDSSPDSGWGGTDEGNLFLRSDVKAFLDTREAWMTGAIFGNIFEQIKQEIGCLVIGTQSGYTLYLGLNPMSFQSEVV